MIHRQRHCFRAEAAAARLAMKLFVSIPPEQNAAKPCQAYDLQDAESYGLLAPLADSLRHSPPSVAGDGADKVLLSKAPQLSDVTFHR